MQIDYGNRYNPYMDNPDMIIENEQLPVFMTLNDTTSHWPYIKAKYCTSPYITISVEPQECTKTPTGQYNMRWYKNIQAMRNVYLHIDESKNFYEVTTIFEGSENPIVCKSITSLVMYLQEQLRIL